MKPHELKAIIIILIGALILCIAPPARGQGNRNDKDTGTISYDGATYNGLTKIITKGTSGPGIWGDPATLVMLKIVLLDRPSVHFYRQGYKRGEQYWYLDGKNIKKLPKNWFVWEYRIIKNY